MYPKWLASAEAAGDAGEGPARVGVPAGAPEPGLRDPAQPQSPSPGAADLGGDLLRIPFLRRLWIVVDDASLASIGWSDDGASLVLDQELFQQEILGRVGADRIFQADNLKSFTQELRRQGFTRQRAPKGMMMYRHRMFLREQPQLLDDMEREGGLGAIDTPGPRKTTKMSQKVPTSCFLRLLGRNSSKEAKSKRREAAAATRGSGRSPSAPPPGDLPAACPDGGSHPGELGGPGGEGTSGHSPTGHATPGPQQPAAQEGLDEEPSSSTAFPVNYETALSFYNSCYAIFLNLLWAVNPGDETDESPEENGEEDGEEDREEDGKEDGEEDGEEDGSGPKGAEHEEPRDQAPH